MKTTEQVNALVDRFLGGRLTPVLYKMPAVILWKGRQIRLPSGKTTWKNKGAARIALTQALSFYYFYDQELTKELEATFREPSELRKYLEDSGIVEIREFKE